MRREEEGERERTTRLPRRPIKPQARDPASATGVTKGACPKSIDLAPRGPGAREGAKKAAGTITFPRVSGGRRGERAREQTAIDRTSSPPASSRYSRLPEPPPTLIWLTRHHMNRAKMMAMTADAGMNVDTKADER
jgi:hypothetical protein